MIVRLLHTHLSALPVQLGLTPQTMNDHPASHVGFSHGGAVKRADEASNPRHIFGHELAVARDIGVAVALPRHPRALSTAATDLGAGSARVGNSSAPCRSRAQRVMLSALRLAGFFAAAALLLGSANSKGQLRRCVVGVSLATPRRRTVFIAAAEREPPPQMPVQLMARTAKQLLGPWGIWLERWCRVHAGIQRCALSNTWVHARDKSSHTGDQARVSAADSCMVPRARAVCEDAAAASTDTPQMQEGWLVGGEGKT